MKFSDQFIPHVIVLVLVILAVLVCFVPCVMPYSRGGNYAAYEGMEEMGKEGGLTAESAAAALDPENIKDANAAEEKKEEEKKDEKKESFAISDLGNVFTGTKSADAPKKESFVPLSASSAPVGAYNEVLDKFSQVNTFGTDGVNGCVSSGLSNSKGYLCLTPELISALKTRGGNAQ